MNYRNRYTIAFDSAISVPFKLYTHRCQQARPCHSAQASIIYASKADMLNVAMFGMTAKQWREDNLGFMVKFSKKGKRA